MSKTNIRLFVPNTTEALDFEYGLLIHYMAYNEAKSRSEISLDYYELSAIDPMTNALDIVERKTITDTTRMQSNRSGFTLDSHYTLSFDQRYNNKIPEQSVRQVWLWLHCNADKDFPFLVEKFTPAEDIVYSRNNQLLTRLWAHEDWLARDMNPLDQQKVSGRIGLITLLTQQSKPLTPNPRQRIQPTAQQPNLPVLYRMLFLCRQPRRRASCQATVLQTAAIHN